MDYRINYPISIEKSHIFEDGVAIGAQGSQNSISLTLTFDETWDGLGKIIMWFDARNHDTQICETVLTSSMRVDEDPRVYQVPFPQEILSYAGKVAITIEGSETVDNETDVILTTEYGYFRVAPSSNDVQDIDPEDEPLTILQQVQNLVEEAEDARDDAVEAAETATSAAEDVAAYATAAEASATAAATSETNAAAYASSAQTSATSAAGSAGDASTSATNAASSATDAAGYASSASDSATAACGSASDASDSATSAAGYASSASDSATAAAGSTSDASDSATSAANSATSAAASAATCSSMVAMTDAELDAICV